MNNDPFNAIVTHLRGLQLPEGPPVARLVSRAKETSEFVPTQRVIAPDGLHLRDRVPLPVQILSHPKFHFSFPGRDITPTTPLAGVVVLGAGDPQGSLSRVPSSSRLYPAVRMIPTSAAIFRRFCSWERHWDCIESQGSAGSQPYGSSAEMGIWPTVLQPTPLQAMTRAVDAPGGGILASLFWNDTGSELAENEQQSIRNAIGIMRCLGWNLYADLLTSELAEGDIEVFDEPVTDNRVIGRCKTWLGGDWIYVRHFLLHPLVWTGSGIERVGVVGRCTSGMPLLVATLVHEAAHARGANELAAREQELAFLRQLKADFDRCFGECEWDEDGIDLKKFLGEIDAWTEDNEIAIKNLREGKPPEGTHGR